MGASLPKRVVTNEELVRRFIAEGIIGSTATWIVQKTGINTRRELADGESIIDHAVAAATDAMRNAEVGLQDIDAVVMGSSIPARPLPADAGRIMEKLGIRPTEAHPIFGFDLRSGCSTGSMGLFVGDAFIRSGMMNRVLVVIAEAYRRILDPKDRIAQAVFGDGAWAGIIEPVRDGYGFLGHFGNTFGALCDVIRIDAGGTDRPVTSKILEEGAHHFKWEPREVYSYGVTAFARALKGALQKAGIAPNDITWLFPHHGNLRMVEEGAKIAGVSKEKLFLTIEEIGNIGGASAPYSLYELWRQGRLKDGDVCAMVTFGAGATDVGSIFRWGGWLPRAA